MIKINSTDSIIDIIQKIGEAKENEITLDFPFGHPVLHNYLSLKVLKNKAGSKTLTIVTNDITSRKIGRKLGINFSIIKDDDFIEHSLKNRILNHNFSFFEYLKFEIRSYAREIKNLFSRNDKINKFKQYSTKYYETNGTGFFMLSLVLSLLVFFIVFFFAINKTYIYIKPEIEVKTVSRNFIFRDIGNDEESVLNDKIIRLKKINKVVSLEETFNTSGIDPKNAKKSTGEVILYNKFEEKIELRPHTRLQTKDGLLFEITNYISIPPGTKIPDLKIIPGEAHAKVTAKDYDTIGRYIGAKGNFIKTKTIFTLPGLIGDSKNMVYAISTTKFSGGSDVYEKVLGEDDIENAAAIFEDKLKREALKQIQSYIEEDNKLNNVVYELLTYGDIFKNAKININKPKNKPLEKLDRFKINGTIEINSYVYNKEILLSKLKDIINEKILEETQNLESIDKKSIRITNIMSETYSPRFEAKLTVEIDSRVSQNFLNKNNTYVQRLKNLIYGLQKKDAEKILLNDKNIRNVDITIQPFFMNKISNIEDNVIFEVEN